MFLVQFWINAIKDDIKRKYNIINPSFITKYVSPDHWKLKDWDITGEDEIGYWLNENIKTKWILYKKIENDTFELKPFSPYANETICKQLIKNFMKTITEINEQIWFTLSYDDQEYKMLIGDTRYNKEEIQRELLFLFQHGRNKIDFLKDFTKDRDSVTHHLYVREDTLPNMLKSGYLELEYYENELKSI